jgi:hypothetical protein
VAWKGNRNRYIWFFLLKHFRIQSTKGRVFIWLLCFSGWGRLGSKITVCRELVEVCTSMLQRKCMLHIQFNLIGIKDVRWSWKEKRSKTKKYNYFCTYCLHNDFVVGNIHYRGHRKGWALKLRLCKLSARIKIIMSKRYIKKQVHWWFYVHEFCRSQPPSHGCPGEGGGHTRLRVRGGPNSNDCRKSFALCLLYDIK